MFVEPEGEGLQEGDVVRHDLLVGEIELVDDDGVDVVVGEEIVCKDGKKKRLTLLPAHLARDAGQVTFVIKRCAREKAGYHSSNSSRSRKPTRIRENHEIVSVIAYITGPNNTNTMIPTTWYREL